MSKTKDDSIPGTIPHLVGADTAIQLLGCGRSQFYERVRSGIYREATLRAGDPAPTEKVFRMADLVGDQVNYEHNKKMGMFRY